MADLDCGCYVRDGAAIEVCDALAALRQATAYCELRGWYDRAERMRVLRVQHLRGPRISQEARQIARTTPAEPGAPEGRP